MSFDSGMPVLTATDTTSMNICSHVLDRLQNSLVLKRKPFHCCLKTTLTGTTNDRHHVHEHPGWPSVLMFPVVFQNLSCWDANLDDTLRRRRDVSIVEGGSWTPLFLPLIHNIDNASGVEVARAG